MFKEQVTSLALNQALYHLVHDFEHWSTVPHPVFDTSLKLSQTFSLQVMDIFCQVLSHVFVDGFC